MGPKGYRQCYNAQDFRQAARRRLPAPLFHYIDGGADDEATLARNSAAFDEVRLIPEGLQDLSQMDLSVEVLGAKLDWPLFLSPTGMSRLFHHDGERAVARAAAKFGTMYSLSTLSTVSIEDIGALTTGPKCFQIYIHKDRDLTYEFVDRCKRANYTAMCLTIDTLVGGNRERDLRTGMVMPPKLTPKSLWSFATHLDWAYNFLTHDKFELANVKDSVSAGTESLVGVMDYINSQFDRSITWQDARDLAARWGGPFAIKGVMSVEDAKRSRDAGASAIMISNHGGRQMDGATAPFDMLGRIVDAVGDDLEIILDGGIRRGSHVLKALAMGASACSVGRAYLYALAAGGQPAVEQAIGRLKDEVERDMILMGVDRVAKLDRSRLQRGNPLDTHRGAIASGSKR